MDRPLLSPAPPLARFRLRVHEAPGVDGNLVDRADQYPIRDTVEQDAYDNAEATTWAVAWIRANGQTGDIGRLLRQDKHNPTLWRLLGEFRYDDIHREDR